MFIDTHCHLSGKTEEEKLKIRSDAENVGVKIVIDTAYDTSSSKEVAEFASKTDGVYCAVGVHPDACGEINTESLRVLKELSSLDKCVLIGEIGLDYHYEPFDKKAQEYAFTAQMALANEVGLPFTVHSRDCTADLIGILTENKSLITNGAIMHCYSGSVETARILLDLGFYVSFSGTLTFKNARALPEVAKFLPMDRILTETDSPYLAPVPFRGTENAPKNVAYVARKIAEIKGVETEKIEEAVLNNALTVLKKLKI